MQAFRCATWRLRSASRRRRSTTIFSNKIDFYRHAVDHAIKQVTDSIEADGAHSGRQADENLRAVRERYRHGLVSHTEVLDAETLGSRAT